MPEKTPFIIEQTLLAIYAISAICGGLGGCAVGAHHYATSDGRRTIAMWLAYTTLGVVFGVVSVAVMSAYHYEPWDLHKLILWSMAGGAAGAIALASANAVVKIMFKRLGIEVQITMRKPDENRRTEDTNP